MIFSLRILLLIPVLLLLTACSEPASKPASTHSITRVASHSPLLHHLHDTDKALNGRSAFYPLPRPDDAFAARLYLIDHATTSLDLQYYIYEDDLMGRVLSAHLLKAAQRGVKVRILLDDISTTGKDHALALLSHHPNIDLRLFNPNKLRTFFRNLALLFDINTLGKRMHNKALVADGVVAIVGGRNIGNVYFTAKSDSLFLDYDILSIGSIVPKIYREFDLYWNSRLSVPSREVLDAGDITSSYQKILKTLNQSLVRFRQTATGKNLQKAPFNQRIKQNKIRFVVAKRTELFYDHPDKIITPESDDTYHISSQLDKNLMHVRKSAIIISPYFIPSEKMMRQLRMLRARGIDITIITNSLASTDVSMVYSGYKASIEPLVKMGVKLYELKPYSLDSYTRKHRIAREIHTSLHTKMIIIDNDRLVVGSANLDPRSNKLNTEIVMLVTSKKLASKQRKEIEAILTLEYLYRLDWGKHPHNGSYGPVWKTIKDGKEEVYYTPPKASGLRIFGMDFMSLLPIKGYL